MNKEIAELIDKSKRSINAARILCNEGDYDFAVSRAYYAIFYISEALLLKKGQSYSKHSAVISAIYDVFVKKGELPKEFHKIFNKAFNLRQQCDYLSPIKITKEVTLSLIGEIEKSVEAALVMLA